MEPTGKLWGERADAAQRALAHDYWNPHIRLYNIQTPCPGGACNTIFHYWWMAHAVDNMVDAYRRTKDARCKETIAKLYDGLLERNGGGWTNQLYDDMEWMAIAWLRAYAATREERYKQAALELWEDIQTGWNDHMGGGIAWQKSQLDYKNTPANAPAVILAARLYLAFGNEADLKWAIHIYEWQTRNLVDPDTGFVWDGMNRQGDGQIDKHWKFTYCQGVYIGAGLELFRTTGDEAYLQSALRTAHAAFTELSPDTAILPSEGTGDGGLFKGIFVRYMTELLLERGASKYSVELGRFKSYLIRNGASLWEQVQLDEAPLFGPAWNEPARGPVPLSTQLSGVMLMEMLAAIEREEATVMPCLPSTCATKGEQTSSK